jgi:choline kinase
LKNITILAAGRGTRLAPITDSLPKALVPVLGKPIIAYTLEALADSARAGLCTVSVVVGHFGDLIAKYVEENFDFVRVIWNHDYAETNNMFSLYLGISAVEPSHSMVFMNGDCLYHGDIIRSAVDSRITSIFCDRDMPHNDESMKISISDGIVSGISKTIGKAVFHAVSCDLYTLQPADVAVLRGLIFKYIQASDLNSWSELALNTSIVEKLIRFSSTSVENRYWYEIDNHDDLAAATARVLSS